MIVANDSVGDHVEGEVRHVVTREVSDYLRTAESPERADALAATTVASDSEWFAFNPSAPAR